MDLSGNFEKKNNTSSSWSSTHSSIKEMEDPTLFHKYPMDSFAYQLDDLDFQPFSASPESYNSSHKHFNYETTQSSFPIESPEYHSIVTPTRPTKQLKIMSTWKASNSSSSSQLISFEHSNSNASSVSSQQFYNLDSNVVVTPKMDTGCGENLDFAAVISQGAAYEEKSDKSFLNNDKRANKANTMTMRNPTQAQDHVLAERKRREKLSRRFIALSAMVPGLKKMDKATVLGDAIKYLKQLQERVKSLEEQVAEKTVDSAVLVKRSVLFADDDSSSSDENSDQSLPEIEARVSGKDVLIRIHCNKQNGRAATILNELEKYHLTVQSSSFLPFGNNTLDITIVAQMNKEHCVKAKDLIKSLRQCSRQFI